MRRIVPSLAIHALLALGAALTLVPLLWMVSASFMPTGEANRFPPRLLPSHGTLEHYAALFTRLSLARPFMNSLIVTAVTTLATFTFLTMWNDFMWPLIVLSDDRNYTLPVALANLVGEHVQDTELMMAGSVLTVLPVLLLFVGLQRHYLRGVMMGSLKE